jgi:hypothetical protein
MRRNTQRRGSAMVEFCLAGIASITVLISTFQLSMGMWNYHTMAFKVHEATRYIAVHGVGCTKPGNSCTVTVGALANKIDSLGVGILSNSVDVTLTTDSGAVTTCAPLNSCFTNTTVWPPSTNNDNKTGKLVTISANYHFRSALFFFWPGQGSQAIGEIWFPASSTQTIVY